MGLPDGPDQFNPGYPLSESANVVIATASDGLSPSMDARLADLTPNVVKLAVSQSVDENASLNFCVPEFRFHFRVDGNACRKKQIDKNTWSLECSLSPPVPENLFGKISEGRPMLGSCDLRSSSNLQTSLSWNLDHPDQAMVVHDISNGGFCVWADENRKLGERVHLSIDQVDSTLIVVAKTQWKFETDNGFLLGCSLLNSRDYERLRELLSS